jgi:hypothetical protein
MVKIFVIKRLGEIIDLSSISNNKEYVEMSPDKGFL